MIEGSFLKNSWIFIVGFALQGEPMLILWLLYFYGSPFHWTLIFGIALLMSYFTGVVYYSLGRWAPQMSWLDRWLKNHQDKFSARIPHRMPGLFLIVMKFLYGLRNPLAIYLGYIRFPLGLFLFWTFWGTLLWLSLYFAGVYLMGLYFQKVIMTYRYALWYIYAGLFIGWGLFQLRKILKKRKQAKTGEGA
ncbi:MAG: hypothetical protein GXO78_15385 [Calditrichaeota bacterium]|nr:hypothetical protein [Calditrichota bacterium]